MDSPGARLFEEAEDLRRSGQLERARSAYFEALKAAPTHAPTLSGLGAVLTEEGLLEAALRAYQELIKFHPSQAEHSVLLAKAHYRLGRLEQAKACYEQALALDPGHAEAHQNLGGLLIEMGDEAEGWRHRQLGFEGRPYVSLPYQGKGPAIPLLILASARGGNLPFLQAVDSRVFDAQVLVTEFFDPRQTLPPHALIWNVIGDAERCQEALQVAAGVVELSEAPLLNPPMSIARTGRLDVARRLGSLKELLVARMAAYAKAELQGPGAEESLRQKGLGYPLLLRSPGFHGGVHLLKVEEQGQLPGALQELPTEEVLAIQFLDTRSADGKTRKYRVIIVGGELYPLHLAVARDWKIHFYSADMADHPEHRAEDQAFLEDMAAVLGPTALAALNAVARELGLDYGGIDFGLDRSGQVVVFEANATMGIFQPPPGALWDYRRRPVQRVLNAVTATLAGRSRQGQDPAARAVAKLLSEGGDERIALGKDGRNRYGRRPRPEPAALAFCSSTASSISEPAFAALQDGWASLEEECRLQGRAEACQGEAERLRQELLDVCGLRSLKGLQLQLGASGTDLHRSAARALGTPGKALTIVMTEASETGLGVPAALRGAGPVQVFEIPSRGMDGRARPTEELDEAFAAQAARLAAAGGPFTLIVSDLSKTGLLAPSPRCALALLRRYPGQVQVLVDACQFRLSSASLKAYLEQGCLVAITGSKFAAGPAFSGALLVPASASLRLPPADEAGADLGLLLRWKAALAELRAFNALDHGGVAEFLGSFAQALHLKLEAHPRLEAWVAPGPQRPGLTLGASWDEKQTIFPFRLLNGGPCNFEQVEGVHRRLNAQGVLLGQPLPLGAEGGIPRGALRLCASARTVLDALGPFGRGAEAVIADALEALDRAGALAASA